MAGSAQAPNVVAILQAFQSPNADERNAATQYLESAQANPDAFVQAMVTVLHEVQNPVQIRQTAAVVLNKLFVTRQESLRAAFEGRWNEVAEPTKVTTREVLLKCLQDPDDNIRRQIAHVLSRIILLDLKLRAWPEAIPSLLAVANDKSREGPRESALMCLGYVCEEVLDSHVADHFSNMLQSIYDAVLPTEPSIRIRRVGMHALSNGLDFLEGTMRQESVRDRLLQVIEGAAKADDVELRQVALSTLARTVELYYDHLTSNWMESLCLLSLDAMKHQNEGVAKQGYEFWATLARTESGLLQASRLGIVDSSRPQCRGYVSAAAATILPTVLEGMRRTMQDCLEDEYDVADEAEWCLGEVAPLAPDAATAAVVPFVKDHIGAAEWQSRAAAASAFGWLVESIEPTVARPLVDAHISAIAKLVQDSVGTVRGAAAWTIGNLISFAPEALLPQYTNDMLDAGAVLLRDSVGGVAVRGAVLLQFVARYFKSLHTHDPENPGELPNPPETSELQPKWAVTVDALASAPANHPNNMKLLAAAYEAVTEFVAAAPNNCISYMNDMLGAMVDKLNDAVKRLKLGGQAAYAAANEQARLCAVVGTIILRLSARKELVLPHSDRIVDCAYTVFHTRPDTAGEADVNSVGYLEETLSMLMNLAYCMEEDFGRYMQFVSPIVAQCLGQFSAADLVRSAAGCAESIVEAMQDAIDQAHLDDIVAQVIQGLESPVLSSDEKPALLGLIQAIFLKAPHKALKYVPHVMHRLRSAAALTAESATQGPPSHETVAFLSRLRAQVALCYCALFLSFDAAVAAPFLDQALEFAGHLADDPHLTDECLPSIFSMLRDLVQCLGRAVIPRLDTPQIIKLVTRGQQSQDFLVKEAVTVRSSVHRCKGGSNAYLWDDRE